MLAVGRLPARERRVADCRLAAEHARQRGVAGHEADRRAGEGDVEEAAAEMATGLKQEPHRHHRRHQAVAEQQHAPDLLRRHVGGAERGGEIEWNLLSTPDGDSHQRQKHGRRQPERHPSEPHAEAHDHRQHQIQQA